VGQGVEIAVEDMLTITKKGAEIIETEKSGKKGKYISTMFVGNTTT
jgi:hypothetical protein